MADQVVSSVTNFALVVVVARSVDARYFGMFSLALAAYALAVGTCRSIAGEPFAIRHSSGSTDDWRRPAQAAAGTALSFGIVCGLVAVAAGQVLPGRTGGLMVALGLSLPGLLLQDTWRYVFMAARRPDRALVNDLVWAGAQLLAVLWVLRRGSPSASAFVVAWGAAAGMAAAVGAAQAGLLPSPRRSRSWLAATSDLWPRLTVEGVALTGTWHLALLVLGAVSGLAAAGSFRAAMLLFGPIILLFLAAPLVLLPELARLVVRAPERLVRASARVAAGLSLLAAAAAGTAWALPDAVGTMVLGTSWEPAHALVVPVGAFIVSAGVDTGAILGLRALGAARRSLRVRVLVAPLLLVSGALGAAVAGAHGAATGLAVANWVAAGLWWWQFVRVARATRPSNRRTAHRVSS